MPAYHQRTAEEKRLFHSRGGKASSSGPNAYRFTDEDRRKALERRAEAERQRHGEEALRGFLNDLEGLMRPDVPYFRAEVLALFEGLMAERGYLPVAPTAPEDVA